MDGKKKLVQVIKANHMSKPDATKKVAERMVLDEKVHVLWGTNGAHLMKIMNQVAKKYKVIVQNASSLPDELNETPNFTRYSFMSTFTTQQVGRALAYYYGKIRKKEKKFYILNQDYLFGHSLANAFKLGLKEYYPEAELVGEDYHKLFLKDFAPYLTKVKASGAEVIYTGDWIPDAANLLKQARQMGIDLPMANLFITEPNFLHEVGVEGTKGLVVACQYCREGGFFQTEGQKKLHKNWNNLWKTKWKKPYNTWLYKHPAGTLGSYIAQTYWMLDVIERAGSTDPEKIIKVWEGDSYRLVSGKVVTMRACDHKVIQDLHVAEFVIPEEQKVSFNIPPYYWFKGTSNQGPTMRIPQDKILPPVDKKLCQ